MSDIMQESGHTKMPALSWVDGFLSSVYRSHYFTHQVSDTK